MSDPVSGTYRTKSEEVKTGSIEQDDPIRILKERLFAAGVILTQEALEKP